VSCGVGHRCSLDAALLWLWHSPAAAAPISPLAWKPPYAAPAALKSKKKKKKKKKRKKRKSHGCSLLPHSLILLAFLFSQPSDKEMFSRSVTSLATDAPASSEQNGALTNGDSKFRKNTSFLDRPYHLRKDSISENVAQSSYCGSAKNLT